ncbi:hypothetical protein [Robertkochia sediminum]|uniref:hypothetical protein n=1 Tax=Robertkochia sediminum TaxID=2785326 RepID=UPI0019341531|nr:hypothetical protein [Robertkochia sediminum]MBL7472213.1 hypothetical protein [Robertkochia sediminum]
MAKTSWTGFGAKKTEGTLIYFNGDRSEIFFPNEKVLQTLDTYETYSADYVMAPRTDDIPYHMENMLSFDEADSSQFYFDRPVEQYSTVEEIHQFIPSVESTEMWTTMVLHEMFHHYQFNNEKYREYAKTFISALPFNPNDFRTLAKEDEDFLPMIQKENDYLMKAISEGNATVRDSLISTYLKERKVRIKKYSTEYPDLEQVEDFYVIQEGSARYMEYKSMLVFSDYANQVDAPIIKGDTMFKGFSEFKEIDLNAPAFNYLVYAGATDYHYTIGFNILRLLDALGVEYKSELLEHPEKGLHNYLEEYLNSRRN